MKREFTLDPIPILDHRLIQELEKEGIKDIHSQTIWRLLIQQNYSMQDLPVTEKIRKVLQKFSFCTSKVVKRTDARDGSTTKLLIELQDGRRVESCIMRYGMVQLEKYPKEELKEDGFKSNKRATLCVSSQVGCSMGCTFCATGTMGLVGNLSSGEILEQLMHANKIEKIRNVVFMGMGEPLDNYDQVLLAIKGMVDTRRFGLSPSRITISTVGVVPKIKALTRDFPQIGLALSLHAPTQEKRLKIVPTSKAWNIKKIIDATEEFIDNQNKDTSRNRKRHVLVEYVLIQDVNDSEETAHELGDLLRGKDFYLLRIRVISGIK
jgi:sorting nexin-8